MKFIITIITCATVFIQACNTPTGQDTSNAPHNIAARDSLLITSHSIGLAALGQTIGDLKQSYKGCTFSKQPLLKYGVESEGKGLLVSRGKEDLLFVWTIRDLKDDDKLNCIMALSNKFHTAGSISPGMTVGALAKHYPQMTVHKSLDFPNIEFFTDDNTNITFAFYSKDSTSVGKYTDNIEPTKVIDTTKTITCIDIIDNK